MSGPTDMFTFTTQTSYTTGRLLDPFLIRQQLYVDAQLLKTPKPNLAPWAARIPPESRTDPAQIRSALNHVAAGARYNTKYYQNPVTSFNCNCGSNY
jgi:hypothetical protein